MILLRFLLFLKLSQILIVQFLQGIVFSIYKVNLLLHLERLFFLLLQLNLLIKDLSSLLVELSFYSLVHIIPEFSKVFRRHIESHAIFLILVLLKHFNHLCIRLIICYCLRIINNTHVLVKRADFHLFQNLIHLRNGLLLVLGREWNWILAILNSCIPIKCVHIRSTWCERTKWSMFVWLLWSWLVWKSSNTTVRWMIIDG